jgi:hypothetical protein
MDLCAWDFFKNDVGYYGICPTGFFLNILWMYHTSENSDLPKLMRASMRR